MKRNKYILQITLSIIAVLQLAPLFMVFVNSVRSDSMIKKYPLRLPEKIILENYPETWIKGEYLIAYRNSFIVGFSTILIVCTCIGLAAYSVSKLRPYCKNFFLAYFIAGLSIPVFAYIVPDYFIFARIGLVDNLIGIILIFSAMNIPLTFLFSRAFFIGIPQELIESSRMDGCTEVQSIWYIIMPLAKPALTTVAIIVFVQTWNEFLFANTFLQDENIRTVSVRFYRFTSEYQNDLAKIFTASVISIMPVGVLYLTLQKKFIEGLTSGAIKN